MLSVIVPVYKSEKTLSRCVESLQRQKDVDLEILLVDDGSPDDCPQICEKLAREDGRIRVLHKENGGVSSARNAGIEAARGEYLMFVDSDDYVEPDMAGRLLKEIGEADMALCGFHHHYVGKDVRKVPETEEKDRAKEFLELYGQGYLNMPWNKLYRRELAGRFDESLSLGEDLLFNLEYLRRADGLVIVRKPLYHYIQNDTGNTLSSKKRDDKLALAKLVWRKAGEYYRDLAGGPDESGVINARLIQEVLDDVESLPFEKGRRCREKLSVIREYCRDPELVEAGSCVALRQADYRVIHFCMRHLLTRTVYLLCVLRAWLVLLERRGRKREEDGTV